MTRRRRGSRQQNRRTSTTTIITHMMNGGPPIGLSVDIVVSTMMRLGVGFGIVVSTMMGLGVGFAFSTTIGSVQLLPNTLTAHTDKLNMKLFLVMLWSSSELLLEIVITLISGSAESTSRVHGRSEQDLMRISNVSTGRYPEASWDHVALSWPSPVPAKSNKLMEGVKGIPADNIKIYIHILSLLKEIKCNVI